MSYADRYLAAGHPHDGGSGDYGSSSDLAIRLLSDADAEIAALRERVEALEALVSRAVLVGFRQSGEGWNGEYPCGDYDWSDARIFEELDVEGIARALLTNKGDET